jgi:5-enolpyruvylshikimate-3-phosphate synthase
MGFSVLAGRIAGVSIDDPSVVSKSWPGFWSVREQMRATAR